ncbi:MAG: Na/Pi cotransporter family protein [Clostridia bacterium]|nr:Na/Pi cotransporter family protein [Clostridia bacterium]
MEIFDVLTLVCGLALFLYGMDVMGDALKKSAGRKLKTILGNLTSNRFKGLLLGLIVTAIIQSSSATTVMVVGFVNSGTMLLSQAVGVIMGANIGTAVTSWLTALNGIEGGADALAWTEWLKPDAWMPILALIGICLIMFAKKSKMKDMGAILMGFAVLMVGMDLMSGAVSGLKGDPDFTKILTMFKNPLLGVLAGTALTAIVQSSSASIGILQALSSTGAINFGMAIPIILGQNIGTCVTAMISAAGAGKNGKRTALVHLYFNIIGVAFWLGMYYLVGWILNLTNVFDVFTLAESSTINMWGIAATHTIFKLLSVGLLFPFSNLLVKLAEKTIKGDDKKGDEYTDMLDDRLLATPSVALERSRSVAGQMAVVACQYIRNSIGLFRNYDGKAADAVRDAEGKVDIYEDSLGSYLVKLSSESMDERDSHEVTKLLHIIGDLERISDHSVNLVDSAEEIKDKDLVFSEEAKAELDVLYAAVTEIVTITEQALVTSDLDLAARIEPLEQVIDDLRDDIKINHIHRLKKSECTVEHGFVLSDILTNLERVADHCSNIGGCLIEMAKNDTLDLHDYTHRVHLGGLEYKALFGEYKSKYALPVEGGNS